MPVHSGGIAMRVLFLALFMALATHVSAQEAQGVAKESPAIEKEKAKPADCGVPDAGSHGLPVTIVETPEQAANAAKREKQSDDHEAADLEAQVRAANAAEDSAATAKRQETPAWTQISLTIAGTIIAVLAFLSALGPPFKVSSRLAPSCARMSL